MPGPALRPGDIVRIRRERWRVLRIDPHRDSAIVDVRGCDRCNDGVTARFLLPFERFQPLPRVTAIRVVRPRRWRHLARAAVAGAAPSWAALRSVARANIAILPFQLEPAMAVIAGRASRVLIADEVGLGKTIQAGVIAAELIERTREPHVLVVAPAGLRDQWSEELRERFALEPFVADAASLSGLASGGPNPWLTHPVVVTSVDFVKRPETLRGLETVVWDLMVFDEAHMLGARSDRAEAATRLGRRARTVVMLTATPHSGDDAQFTRLCGLGDIDDGFPLLAFRRTRQDAGLVRRRRTTVLRVRTTPHESRLHAALLEYVRLIWRQKGAVSPDARLAAMVLARRACSSPASLAASLERRLSLLSGAPRDEQLMLPLALSDEGPGLELGSPGLHDVRDECRQLSTLLALAQEAQQAESKCHALARLLGRSREPAIVFTEYRDTLERLERALATDQAVVLHGGLSAAERRDVVRTFTAGRARLLLATDAASEGLNLHHRCRLVVNLEIPWSPRRLEQRVGRVDRIGQQRRVHEIRLLAAGTVEEATLAVLTRRAERARSVLEQLCGDTDERQVAAAVLGDAVPRDGTAPSLEGVFTADLRNPATAEAARIDVVRRLGSATQESDRPFACAIRAAGRPIGAYWLYRLAFADQDERPLWNTVVALTALATRQRLRRAADVRRFVAACLGSVEAAAAADDAALVRLQDALLEPTRRAIAREVAIAASARREGARLAAPFVQRSLFDRRAERAAADQEAALEELLARCQAGLDRLDRQLHARAAGCQPIFALIRTA